MGSSSSLFAVRLTDVNVIIRCFAGARPVIWRRRRSIRVNMRRWSFRAYECRETVKLRSEPIRFGPVPMEQRTIGGLTMLVGSQVRVAYLPGDPSKAILADNTGLMNE